MLLRWLQQSNRETELKKRLSEAEAELDAKAYATYPKLTVGEVQSLVVGDKWLDAIAVTIRDEVDRVTRKLTIRITTLADRYRDPLWAVARDAAQFETRVTAHLQAMGFEL